MSSSGAIIPVEVVAGIILHKGRILCMQRGQGKYSYLSGKFEFPGGKVEPGEEKHEALMRELREEMNFKAEVRPEDFFCLCSHRYPDFSINLHCYLVRAISPEFECREHISYCWLRPCELKSLDWAQADIEAVERLVSMSDSF